MIRLCFLEKHSRSGGAGSSVGYSVASDPLLSACDRVRTDVCKYVRVCVHFRAKWFRRVYGGRNVGAGVDPKGYIL